MNLPVQSPIPHVENADCRENFCEPTHAVSTTLKFPFFLTLKGNIHDSRKALFIGLEVSKGTWKAVLGTSFSNNLKLLRFSGLTDNLPKHEGIKWKQNWYIKPWGCLVAKRGGILLSAWFPTNSAEWKNLVSAGNSEFLSKYVFFLRRCRCSCSSV